MILNDEQVKNIVWQLLDNAIRGGEFIDEIAVLLKSMSERDAKELVTEFLDNYTKGSVLQALQEGWLNAPVLANWVNLEEYLNVITK